jgi:hypothetical protein
MSVADDEGIHRPVDNVTFPQTESPAESKGPLTRASSGESVAKELPLPLEEE